MCLETSLPKDFDVSDINISGFDGSFIKAGNGKGIATFLQKDLDDYFLTLLNDQTLQISVLEFEELDIISVYR